MVAPNFPRVHRARKGLAPAAPLFAISGLAPSSRSDDEGRASPFAMRLGWPAHGCPRRAGFQPGKLGPRMRATKAFVLVLAVGLPALAFAPYVAAQGDSKKGDSAEKSGDKSAADKGSDKGEKKYDPNNTTALSQFMETCIAGNAKYVAHDIAGAIEAYKKAIQLSPKNALGHYLLGEAQLGAGSTAEAESEWKLAAETVDDKNPNLKAHVLFVIADLKERLKKWDEAKAAWQAYGEFATKHGDAGAYPSTASSRQQVIDDMIRQDKLYEVVRQRIAADKDGGASEPAPSASSKPAALPKK
jgi:tetratricopeptide (TPR) repeat protein